MKRIFLIIPWLILLIPFIVLAYFYSSLANEILIARSVFGNEAILAPKTVFTVFRVPLIEVVCAAAIEVMRRNFENEKADYFSIWNILLYTVTLKSLFQAFEIASTGDLANLFYYSTLGIVVIGIISALVKGRSYFSNFFRGNLKFNFLEKALLFTGLFYKKYLRLPKPRNY